MGNQKTFIDKCAIKEHTFDDGNSVLNCAFNVNELMAHIDENGWVNITIAKRREPSEKGNTHYAYKDDFKPKKQDLPF
jgi:hypothetical protein|tara:strand:+ start:934 stop:1167 length:234 start_codon:yes stop_codon:yes gene_type:complete